MANDKKKKSLSQAFSDAVKGVRDTLTEGTSSQNNRGPAVKGRVVNNSRNTTASQSPSTSRTASTSAGSTGIRGRNTDSARGAYTRYNASRTTRENRASDPQHATRTSYGQLETTRQRRGNDLSETSKAIAHGADIAGRTAVNAVKQGLNSWKETADAARNPNEQRYVTAEEMKKARGINTTAINNRYEGQYGQLVKQEHDKRDWREQALAKDMAKGDQLSNELDNIKKEVKAPVGKFLVDVEKAGVEMGMDAAVGLATGTGPVGFWGSMASRSFGQSYTNALREGATDDEAAKYAAAATGIEAGTEAMFMPFGKLGKSIFGGGYAGSAANELSEKVANKLAGKATGQTARDLIYGGTKTGFAAVEEGLEEMVSEGLDPMVANQLYAQNVTQRQQAEFKNQLQAQVDAGEISQAQADDYYEKHKGELDITKSASLGDMLYAGAVGGALGLMGGGLSNVAQNAAGARAMNVYGPDGIKDLASRVVDADESMGDEVSGQARAIAEMVKNGDAVANGQVNELVNAARSQEKRNQTSYTNSMTAAQNVIKNSGSINPIQTVQVQDQNGRVHDVPMLAENTQKAYDSQIKANYELTKSLMSNDSQAQNVADAITQIQLGVASDPTVVENFTLSHPEARAALTGALGLETLPDTNEGTRRFLYEQIASNLINTSTMEDTTVRGQMKGIMHQTEAQGYGRNGQMEFAGALSDEQLDALSGTQMMAFKQTFDTFYEAGIRDDYSWEQISNLDNPVFDMVPENVRRRAFTAGMRDQNSAQNLLNGSMVTQGDSISNTLQKANKAGRKATGTLTVNVANENRKSLGLMQTMVWQKVAGELGIDIVLVDDSTLESELERAGANLDAKASAGAKTANGFYLDTLETIFVNTNADRGLDYVLAHEITHYLRKHAEDSYNKLAKLVADRWAEKGGMNEAIKAYGEARSKAGETLEYDQILEEIIADSTYEFLLDDTILDQIAKTEPSPAQHILDAIRFIIGRLRRILADETLPPVAQENLFSQLDILKEAEALWLDAFNVARRSQGAVPANSIRTSQRIDSEGNQLSDGQIEYFKDSKVRDENGRLKVMYHGTNQSGFTVFDPEMADDSTSLFFTDDIATASSYSDTHAVLNVYDEADVEEHKGWKANYPVYLNITNPYVIDADGRYWNQLVLGDAKTYTIRMTDIDEDEWTGHLTVIDEDGNTVIDDVWDLDDFRDDFYHRGMAEDDIDELRYGDVDEVTTKLADEGNDVSTRDIAMIAKEKGHDGVIFENIVDYGEYSDGYFEPTSTVVIAFSPEQVKAVQNESPTTNPDIRFSQMSSAELDEAYEDAYWDDDEETVRDILDAAAARNGYKYRGYHHTENYFTEFDLDKARRNMDIQGFYFSADPEAEAEYGSLNYDVYLKMENPYVIDSKEKNDAIPVKFGEDDYGVKVRNWLKDNGYDSVIRTADYYGAEADEYIVLDPEQIKSAELGTYNDEYGEDLIMPSQRFDSWNKDIRFNLPTFYKDLTKIKGTWTPTEVDSAKKLMTRSGRDITYDLLKDEAERKAFLEAMDDMAQFITDAGNRYHFIGLDDIVNAEVKVRRDKNGKPKSVILSGMVKNGEYPVNFDLTTVCKKRQGFMQVIDEFAKRGVTDNQPLTDAKLWKINEALKNEGIETACLGCFVEARRYNINNFVNKVVSEWNNAVDEIRAEQGETGDVPYFDFARGENVDLNNMDYDAIDKTWSGYNKDKSETHKTPKGRFRSIVKTGGAEFQKYLQPSDLITAKGVEGLKAMSKKNQNFFTQLKAAYGTAAPKEVMAYSPYNSEIALLPNKKRSGKKWVPLAEHMKSIGGVRMQSFSDFMVQFTFDYMQMVADMAARGLPAHAYTKEIAFAKLFGQTGIKINMSVMFDIDPALGKDNAGLAFVPKAVWESDKMAEDRKYHLEATAYNHNGQPGYLIYNVGDRERADRVYEENLQKYMDQGMDQEEAQRLARKDAPFVQSIEWKEAVDLQKQEGYSANIGTIGVGFSKQHIKLMLGDPNIRYIIPYHSSSLPVVIKDFTNINQAEDYTDRQNTRRLLNIKDADGNVVDYDINKKAEELGSYRAAWAEFNERGYKVEARGNFKAKEGATAEEKALEKEEAKMGLSGTGDFHVYDNLGEQTPQQIAEEYLKWCGENNLVPMFHEFAGHENYYKCSLFDFNVIDSNTGETVPQEAVKMKYPGANLHNGETDMTQFKQILDEEMQKQNNANEHMVGMVSSIADNLERTYAEMDAQEEAEQVRFSLKDIDGMTREEYNKYGWAKVNDILDEVELADFMHKVGVKTKNRNWYFKLPRGRAMFAVGHDGVNNMLVISDGDFISPSIERIYYIAEFTETEIENVRRGIYGREASRGEISFETLQNYWGNTYVGKFRPEDFPAFEELELSAERSKGKRAGGENTELQDRRGSEEGTESIKVTPEMDAEYRKAYESNDVETAQRLVNEAARRAGYDNDIYHGTQADFTVFNSETNGMNYGAHFAPSRDNGSAADYFAENGHEYGKPGKVMNLKGKFSHPFETFDLFADERQYMIQQMHELATSIRETDPDKFEKAWDIFMKLRNVSPFDQEEYDYLFDKDANSNDVWPDDDIAVFDDNLEGFNDVVWELMDFMEYDSFKYWNDLESVEGEYDYVLRHPNQVKSADPFTFDDDGELIPLSERFNEDSDDIRFSQRIPTEDEIYEYMYTHPDEFHTEAITPAGRRKNANMQNTLRSLEDQVERLKKNQKKSKGDELDETAARETVNNLIKTLMAKSVDGKKTNNKLVKETTQSCMDMHKMLASGSRDAIANKAYTQAKKIVDSLVLAEGLTEEYDQYEDYLASDAYANVIDATAGDLIRIATNGQIYQSMVDKYESIIASLKQRQQEAVLAERMASGREAAKRIRKTREQFDAYKVRTNETILNLRGQRDQSRQRLRDYKRTQKDNKARRKSMKKLNEDYKWFMDRLLPNRVTDEKHVPSRMVKPLADLLQYLDLETEYSKKLEAKTGEPSKKTINLRDMRAALEDIAKSDEAQMIQEDEELIQMMEELQSRIDGVPVFQLDNSELDAVQAILHAIRVAVDHANKMYASSRAVDDTAKSVIWEANEYAANSKKRREGGALQKFMDGSLVKPYEFFERMGNAMLSTYLGMRRGLDTQAVHMREVKRFYKRLFKSYENKGKPGSKTEEWRSKKAQQEFTLESGEKISLNPAQVMSLYCLRKRMQAMGHILGQGICASEIRDLGVIQKAIGEIAPQKKSTTVVSLEDVDSIIKSLNKEQRKVADALQDFMNGPVKDWGNETSLLMYDRKKFTELNYFPIESQNVYLAANFERRAGNVESIKNFGFTKGTVVDANNPIVINDIFEVFAKHVNQMNLYNAYAPAISDFTKVYNYKDVDGNKVESVQAILADTYGGSIIDNYISHFMSDIQNNTQARRGGVEAVASKLMGNAKKAAISASPRVALQQPTAIIRAFMEIDFKYALAAFKELTFASMAYNGLTKNLLGREAKFQNEYEDMLKHCPTAYWKSMGFNQVDMAHDIEDILMNNEWNRLDLLTTGIYGFLDSYTWTKIWMMIKAEQKDLHPDVEYGSDEFYELCNNRAIEVFDKTQVVDSPFHRSDVMRSKDLAIKQITSFKAEPTTTFNMARLNILKAQDLWAQGKKDEARNIYARLAIVYVANALACSAAAGIADAFLKKGGDDDDDDDKTWLGYWLSNTAQNFRDNVNPAGLIPFVDQFGQYAEGWGSSNLITDGLASLVQTFAKIEKKATGGDVKKSWPQLIEDLAKAASPVTGIPFKNIIKYGKGLLDVLGINVFAAEQGTTDEAEKSSIFMAIADTFGNANTSTSTADTSTGGGSGDNEDESGEENHDRAITMNDIDYGMYDYVKTGYSSEGLGSRVRKLFGADEAEIKSEAEQKHFNEMVEKVKAKGEGKYGDDYYKAIQSAASEGYTKMLQAGDIYTIKEMRKVIEAAGGDVEKFDEKCISEAKTALKKNLGDTGNTTVRWALTSYLRANGVSDEEISESVCKSDTAKAMQKAIVENDEDKWTDYYMQLTQAGMTEEGYQKLYNTRWKVMPTETTGEFSIPATGYVASDVNSNFGQRWGTLHAGVDIAMPTGTEIQAADGGEVVFVGQDSARGKYIDIKHDNGYVSRYQHLSWYDVDKGQKVTKGEYIGKSGNTGNTTGPHLHWAIYKSTSHTGCTHGTAVDPMTFVASS